MTGTARPATLGTMLSRESLTVVIKFVLRVRLIGLALVLLWIQPQVQAEQINIVSLNLFMGCLP